MKIISMAFALAVVLPSVAFSQVTLPKVGEVAIKSTKIIGDGCPRGSANVIVTNSIPGSKAADLFMVVFDKFTAESGPGVKIGDRSNRCNITMKVEFPEGFRFKFKNISFEGYAELERGLTAEFESLHTRPGARAVRTMHRLHGPYSDDFSYQEVGSGTPSFWTSCEGSSIMSVQAMIRLRGNRNLKGLITRDIQDGLLSQNFEMEWEKCDD